MKNPRVIVHRPGLFSSVQDQGRWGYASYGVGSAGAMDLDAARLANALVGNPMDAAVLEITGTGPKLEFTHQTILAVVGGEFELHLRDRPILNNRSYEVSSGSILQFGKLMAGYRAYLALRGGFQTEVVLGSRSWFPGITQYQRLQKGQELPYDLLEGSWTSARAAVRYELPEKEIEVLPGPEYSWLNQDISQQLATSSFTVSTASNRMAVMLEALPEVSLQEMITAPVLPGTVQLTPSGKLMILMRDCQTTGGYPRILQLSQSQINAVSQQPPGTRVILRLQEQQ